MEREGDAGCPVSGRRALGVLGAAPAERAGLRAFEPLLKTGCKIPVHMGRAGKLSWVQTRSPDCFRLRHEAPCSCSGKALGCSTKGFTRSMEPQVPYTSEKAASHKSALQVGQSELS